MHGRLLFAKLSVHDGSQVSIAAMHPDFVCRLNLRSLMEFAGWLPITDVHSRCGVLLGFDQPRSDLSCHHVVIA